LRVGLDDAPAAAANSVNPIVVFSGPSLLPSDRVTEGFDWRPPARAGDILALLEDPPARVCLIDGLFDGCPAPWHKEILVLMAAGTRMFGGASMGALRAAELDRCGMTGVGRIYRAYRDGRLRGDDEVALVHATKLLGWAPLTVPMVEMRAALVAAVKARIVAPALARTIRELIHEIHFTQRDWPAMKAACHGLLGSPALARMEAMHVPLKRLDALECLRIAQTADDVPADAAFPPITQFTRALARERQVEAAFARELRRARRIAERPLRRQTDGGA